MSVSPRVYRAYGPSDLPNLKPLQSLSRETLADLQAVAAVLPFRVNDYVLESLIDWDNIPEDPIYQLTFPQPGMLSARHLAEMRALIAEDAPRAQRIAAARKIHAQLNPHPAGQRELNVPRVNGQAVPGIQHKYDETVLFFPSQGQTCHAYCTYCFRWAQFVGDADLKFATREVDGLISYLKANPQVTDVLITGGDPMIMKTKVLRRYIEPLLQADLEHLQHIRIGTKAPAYWPFRFTTDKDADDLMALFEEVVAAGKHLALMAHFSHERELDTPVAQAAIRRIRSTGAVVRCQAPLIRHVNDQPQVWRNMWLKQVALGAVPYYMFVERDTGPKAYFEVPLHRALSIFEDAYRQTSGLARTVRGPSMSATPGKVLVDGTLELNGHLYFALKFIQARNPAWVNRLFLAEYDTVASWLDDLRPAMDQDQFFYEEELQAMGANLKETSAETVMKPLSAQEVVV